MLHDQQYDPCFNDGVRFNETKLKHDQFIPSR